MHSHNVCIVLQAEKYQFLIHKWTIKKKNLSAPLKRPTKSDFYIIGMSFCFFYAHCVKVIGCTSTSSRQINSNKMKAVSKSRKIQK